MKAALRAKIKELFKNQPCIFLEKSLYNSHGRIVCVLFFRHVSSKPQFFIQSTFSHQNGFIIIVTLRVWFLFHSNLKRQSFDDVNDPKRATKTQQKRQEKLGDVHLTEKKRVYLSVTK